MRWYFARSWCCYNAESIFAMYIYVNIQHVSVHYYKYFIYYIARVIYETLCVIVHVYNMLSCGMMIVIVGHPKSVAVPSGWLYNNTLFGTRKVFKYTYNTAWSRYEYYTNHAPQLNRTCVHKTSNHRPIAHIYKYIHAHIGVQTF